MEQPRRRRSHERSRTGCVSCRKRHVRCDESRPTCKKCLTRGAECEYPALEIWSAGQVGQTAHKPKIVGKQAWLHVWQLPKIPKAAFDPFGCLPTPMPLKSFKLFQYFVRVHEEECDMPLSRERLAKSIDNENSFRNVMLLAALHYTWNSGDPREYEATFLTHKIEAIRNINRFLDEPEGNFKSIRTQLDVIATLCLIETTMGHLDAAEAHLQGLITLIGSEGDSTTSAREVDGVTHRRDAGLRRYVLICIVELMRYNLQAKYITSDQALEKVPPTAPSHPFHDDLTKDSLTPIYQLVDRLSRLWLIPYFLTSSEDLQSNDVDAVHFVHHLRTTTTVHGGCHPSPTEASTPTYVSDEMSLNLVETNMYFLWGLSDNGVSLYPIRTTERPLWCSWIGLTIASGFYNHGLLEGGLAFTALSNGSLCWVVAMLQHDIADTKEAMLAGRHDRALWLWRVILGAYGVTALWTINKAAPKPDTGLFGGEAKYKALATWFENNIRLWATVMRIRDWDEAKSALATIVWPTNSLGETLTRTIWEQAMLREPMIGKFEPDDTIDTARMELSARPAYLYKSSDYAQMSI